MKDYVIPFLYTIKTRLKGKEKMVAYLFTFIIPVFLYAITYSYIEKKSYGITILATIIGIIGVMSVYEIGYIRNDIYAIKKEKNPTLRLSKDDMTFVKGNIKIILIVKYLIALIALICIFALKLDWIYYLIGLILIEIFYLGHNFFRGKLSIITFFVLSTLRYVVPLVFIGGRLYTLIAVFIFAISIPRTIEKAAEKKFNIKFMQTILDSIDFNYIRVMYYLALVINIFAQYSMIHISIAYIVMSVYYLIYRGAIAIMILARARK